MIAAILVLSIVFFYFAYVYYGKKLGNLFDLNNEKQTPAHSLQDNIDYIPTPAPILMGHHFSSIAGAGPIVGPIIAALAFGWLPVLCWILVGAVLIGGVHDATSLIASIRYKAKSIACVAKENVSTRAYLLFLVFIWLALVYVVTVFMDLTSTTFSMDKSAASSSIMFIGIALCFGLSHYKLKIPFSLCTVAFVSMLLGSVWLGNKYPLTIPPVFGDVQKTWSFILIGYCFIASITPVWFLLQPRDYLSSYCLYISAFGAFLGILLGGFPVNFPAYIGFEAGSHAILYPLLFINVACGACSGFHSLVSSGTTSKQLNLETDAIKIGYGAMLIEGIVAVIALATIMIIGRTNPLCNKSPLIIYSAGMGKFFGVFGLDAKIGQSFALLALSTFILTTLDTATRLGRYILEEMCQAWDMKINRYFSTALTLVLPAIFIVITLKDVNGNPIPAWKAIWPVFGATNQLLAALTLLTVTVWLRKMEKPFFITLIPMIFMLVTSMWALVLITQSHGVSLIGVIAVSLFLLGCLFGFETLQIFRGKSRNF